MGWFDDALDFGSDLLDDWGGDIIDIGGSILGWEAAEGKQENLKKIAKKQKKEILRSAKHNAALQRYDADLYRKQALSIKQAADFQVFNNARTAERIISTQTARYGKAGVAPSEGTPLRVAVQTQAESERDGRMIHNAGKSAKSRALDAARKYEQSADETLRAANVHADILDAAMEDQLTGMEYQQWATGAQDLFNYGIRNEWWS